MPSPEATDFQGVGTSCKSFGPSFMPGQWPRNLAGYFSGDTRRSRGPVESRRTRDGMDYCNAETEQWIWSIGRHRKTGEILASHTDELFNHRNFECLWLR